MSQQASSPSAVLTIDQSQQHTNDIDMMETSGPSFTDLPSEIRCIIYGYIMRSSGVIHIWSKHSWAKHCDTNTINLMHVNALIRSEVLDFFYENQMFQFRSFEAMEQFCREVDARHVARIRNIMLGDYLCFRNPKSFLAQLPWAARPFKSVNRIICPKLRTQPRWCRAIDGARPIIEDGIKILGIIYSFPIFQEQRPILNELSDRQVSQPQCCRTRFGIELGTKDMTPMKNISNTEDGHERRRAVFERTPIVRHPVDIENFEKSVKTLISARTVKKREKLGVRASKWSLS